MKRDLLVGVAQWLATPGEPRQNMSVALGMMDDAASRGVELLRAARALVVRLRPRDAGPRRPGGRRTPRRAALGAPGRGGAHAARCGWPPGSVPELGEDGLVYDTALVFNPRGELVAWHRKAHLYPPTLEPTVFTPGDRLTTFDDPALGRVGLVVCFDGDFPEVARTLALRGARLVLAPSAYEVEGANAWDLLYPARRPDQQPVVGAGQPGRLALHVDPARCQPDRGADRHRGGRGQPGRAGLAPAGPSSWCTASTCTSPTQREGDLRAPRGRAPSRPLRRARRAGLPTAS